MPIIFGIEAGSTLIIARGLFVAALLSLFGALAFRIIVAPKALAKLPAEPRHRIHRQLRIVCHASCAGAVVALLAWLVLQASDMAGAPSLHQAAAAVPVVLAGTVFGHVILLQFAGLVATATALGTSDLRWRQRTAFAAAAATTALQAGHGHAVSMYDGLSVLLLSDVVHLLAAGAWLGGLIPLWLVIRAAPPAAGAMAARWFSPMGKVCVAAIAASAAFQGWVLVGSIPGLVGTAYGWMVLIKLGLFGGLCGFAWINRYRFAPALLRGDGNVARRTLLDANHFRD